MLAAVITLGVLGLSFGALLVYASKKFAVYVDPRELAVEAALPGVNCGSCGEAGCSSFAHSLVTGKIAASACTVANAETKEKLGGIMGVSVDTSDIKSAMVLCYATPDDSANMYNYSGIETCKAVSMVAGGNKKCSFGCLGLGDCERVCPSGAIVIKNDLAWINESKCISCELCVKECPRHIIAMVPIAKKIHVMCSSCDDVKTTKVNCNIGCNACKICEKKCEDDAIHVINNHAIIDYAKCTQCGICVEKCPRKIIKDSKAYQGHPVGAPPPPVKEKAPKPAEA